MMIAIQAMDEVIGRLTEASADEAEVDPNDRMMLMDYPKAARRLEAAHTAVCAVEDDLPAYTSLVNHTPARK